MSEESPYLAFELVWHDTVFLLVMLILILLNQAELNASSVTSYSSSHDSYHSQVLLTADILTFDIEIWDSCHSGGRVVVHQSEGQKFDPWL